MSNASEAVHLVGGIVPVGLPPQEAERMRAKNDVDCTRCAYARPLRHIFDNGGGEEPMYVGCGHAVHGPKAGGECLGQCRAAGDAYGFITLHVIRP